MPTNFLRWLAPVFGLAAACTLREPPLPCEADSDCGTGASCLRELPLLPVAEAKLKLGRDPKELCTPNKRSPLFSGFNAKDGKLYAGAAKIDVTPRDFETHTNIEDPARCPKNRPWLFEGYFDAPLGQADPLGDPNNPCLEKFNDKNGNGYFDAVWMGGFDNSRAAQGIDEEVPIMARILVLAQGNEHFAIVALDLVGFGPAQQEELRKILHTELGIDRNRVLIHATHNHESPDTVGIWGPVVTNSANDVAKAIVDIAGGDLGTFNQVPIRPGMPPEYWISLEAKVVQAMRQAMSRMRPAKIKFAQPSAPMRSRPVVVNGQTINVDDIRFDHENVELPDFNGNGIINDDEDISSFIGGGAGRLLMTDLKLPHITDPVVSAVQAVDERTNETIATFVNWTNHVEALSDENVLLSADYAGFLCNYVERVLGGVAVFTVGTVGGLQTQLRDAWVPMMDADGNFLGEGGRIVATIDQAAKAPNSSREKAAGLGRVIGRTAVEALREAEFATLSPLKTSVRYAWVPLDNPFFYIGAQLGILPGLIEWISGKKRSDVFALSSNVPECGGSGCLRTDIVLADLGPLRFLSSPGEFYPEYVVGRAASSFRYGSERMKRYTDVNDNGTPDIDEPIIRVDAGALDEITGVDLRGTYTVRYPLNPQRFTAIPGLRPEDARRNGTRALIVVAEANNAIGYLIPESDHINRYEGFLEGVGDYLSVLGAADLRVMLDLKIPEEVIFKKFIKDVEERFKEVLADVPGRGFEDHVNQQGDENSTGRRSGNIVYNTMCELLHRGTCPTPLPVSPDPAPKLPRGP
jgi:hypothetical protein